ncbi:SDR family oxidoreductase [bacterium]|nr:SDR family oxidoreductase [bacterium]
MASPIDGGNVLITGASSGIGREMARQIAPRAKALVLVARRTERLEELKSEFAQKYTNLKVLVQPCDLTDQASIDTLLETVLGELGTIDVLVNNAGFGDLQIFDKAAWDKLDRMIRLNINALTYLTHKLVPAMVERKSGGIINVSSSFGMSFLPGFSVYIGTKHFVNGFCDALVCDLAGTGVRVTCVCPGPVKTEFNEVAQDAIRLPNPAPMEISAERCARESIAAFDAGKARVVPGTVMKIMMFMEAMTPDAFFRSLYGMQGKIMRKKAIERGV